MMSLYRRHGSDEVVLLYGPQEMLPPDSRRLNSIYFISIGLTTITQSDPKRDWSCVRYLPD